jgi:hypothetical protein
MKPIPLQHQGTTLSLMCSYMNTSRRVGGGVAQATGAACLASTSP